MEGQMIIARLRLRAIKMEMFDQITKLEAVTPNDGGLTKFEEGQLSVLKLYFNKLMRKDYDIASEA
jgi:hypothetical protein